ncbi:MAG TPA: regulatory iron-sulfur-containing complex subunit RicT [Bacteroidales bacterium]|nr:regulatory iron-sulfur-containing complex subunit RicT [Bacteroidales bacterium]
MDTSDKKIFLTRGCRCAPQPYTRQLTVYSHGCNKLDSSDWLKDITPPDIFPDFDIVEVRFKNGRKDFFRCQPGLELETGDIVAVEASPGHEIGIVSLTGPVVRIQMKAKKVNPDINELKKAYRKAKVSDIEKWIEAVRLENKTMFQSRELASRLNLVMKISDVEYQGDRTKATFYYTADERVDFRELIRVLADAFHVRIEMRQIGMRQEASKLGGIGPCGRELCCATWLTSFRSVSTNAARTQQLSLNPQKLAGQCSKLKCCINFENDCYLDSLKSFPENASLLVTKQGKATLQKTDVLKGLMGYSYPANPGHIVMIPINRVREVQLLNSQNQYPDDLTENIKSEDMSNQIAESKKSGAGDNHLEESLTRFDQPQNSNKKGKKGARASKKGNFNKPS